MGGSQNDLVGSIFGGSVNFVMLLLGFDLNLFNFTQGSGVNFELLLSNLLDVGDSLLYGSLFLVL